MNQKIQRNLQLKKNKGVSVKFLKLNSENKIENKIGTIRNGMTKLNNKKPSLRKYQFGISDLPQKRENLGHR
jgi:hypothetical protein